MTDPSIAERISHRSNEHARLFGALAARETADSIEASARMIAASLGNGGKVIFFGNGGSAADAEHLSAEFVGRFRADRRPLASIALGSNSAVVTALGNDYGFEQTVFARELEALAQPGDAIVALSTSGRSPNVISALAKADELGLGSIAIVGSDHHLGGEVDHLVVIDSKVTALIQEMQAAVGHMICEMVEDLMGFTS